MPGQVVMFVQYQPPKHYDPPTRRLDDDDRAARLYASLHWSATMHNSVCLAADGACLPISPIRAVLDQDNDDRAAPTAAERLYGVIPENAVLVDSNTAHIVVQIADALNVDNRAKFLGLPVHAVGPTVWELLAQMESP